MGGLTMKYFVLKPAGDDSYAKASRAAMRTYANRISEENRGLCEELYAWADREATTQDQHQASDLEIIRRIADRGLSIAQAEDAKFVDIFQHLLDEIKRCYIAER